MNRYELASAICEDLSNQDVIQVVDEAIKIGVLCDRSDGLVWFNHMLDDLTEAQAYEEASFLTGKIKELQTRICEKTTCLN